MAATQCSMTAQTSRAAKRIAPLAAAAAAAALPPLPSPHHSPRRLFVSLALAGEGPASAPALVPPAPAAAVAAAGCRVWERSQRARMRADTCQPALDATIRRVSPRCGCRTNRATAPLLNVECLLPRARQQGGVENKTDKERERERENKGVGGRSGRERPMSFFQASSVTSHIPNSSRSIGQRPKRS
jgi:hypothetical protein